MKFMILGHGRSGKDSTAEILRDKAGITFRSSSDAACEKAVFPWLSKVFGYETIAECYADRANHREVWKRLITAYNTPDKGKLCREILAESDCYVGMRCPEEFSAVRHLFDLVIWVDAHKRVPPDPTMLIKQEPGMVLIDNNGSEADLPDAILKGLLLWQCLQDQPAVAA